MLIYNYDKETKIFCGESEAFESPEDKGQFLIPAHATTKKIPKYNVNTQYCVFIDGDWVIKNIELTIPPPELTIGELITQKISHICKTKLESDVFTTSVGFGVNISKNLFNVINEFKMILNIINRKNLGTIEILDTNFDSHLVNSEQLNTIILELEDFWYDTYITKNLKIKKVKKAKTKKDLDKI